MLMPQKSSSKNVLQPKAAVSRQLNRPNTGAAVPYRGRNSTKPQERDDSLDREIEMMNHGLNNAKHRALNPGLSPSRVNKAATPKTGPSIQKVQSMRAFQPASHPDRLKVAEMKSPKRNDKVEFNMGNIFSKKKESPSLVQAAAYKPDEKQPDATVDVEKNNKRIAKENQSLLEKMKDAFKLKFGDALPDLSEQKFVKENKFGESVVDDNLEDLFKSHNHDRTGPGGVCDPCLVPEALFQKFPMPKNSLKDRDFGPKDLDQAKPIFGDANSQQPGYKPPISPFEKKSIYSVVFDDKTEYTPKKKEDPIKNPNLKGCNDDAAKHIKAPPCNDTEYVVSFCETELFSLLGGSSSAEQPETCYSSNTGQRNAVYRKASRERLWRL